MAPKPSNALDSLWNNFMFIFFSTTAVGNAGPVRQNSGARRPSLNSRWGLPPAGAAS